MTFASFCNRTVSLDLKDFSFNDGSKLPQTIVALSLQSCDCNLDALQLAHIYDRMQHSVITWLWFVTFFFADFRQNPPIEKPDLLTTAWLTSQPFDSFNNCCKNVTKLGPVRFMTTRIYGRKSGSNCDYKSKTTCKAPVPSFPDHIFWEDSLLNSIVYTILFSLISNSLAQRQEPERSFRK